MPSRLISSAVGRRADQRHAVAGHRELGGEQGTVRGPQDQNVVFSCGVLHSAMRSCVACTPGSAVWASEFRKFDYGNFTVLISHRLHRHGREPARPQEPFPRHQAARAAQAQWPDARGAVGALHPARRARAPSVSYLSMIESGKRVPSRRGARAAVVAVPARAALVPRRQPRARGAPRATSAPAARPACRSSRRSCSPRSCCRRRSPSCSRRPAPPAGSSRTC